MVDRREFLGALAAPAVLGAASLKPGRSARLAEVFAADREGELSDEDFWFEIQQAFTVDRSLVNLNNGGVSPSPAWVQEAQKRHLDFSQEAPAYSMWRVLEPRRETVRQRLARAWGVDTEEIAIVRNASEGLQTCQFGLDLARGDEVLTTDQDYPRMITTFRQRERREGIVLKQFKLPVPAEDPAAVVELFRSHMTERTKLVLVSHMVNLTGQILPVREIVAMARERGVPTIVDGAHALAHFDFKLSDLDCDYYASSLHKWLCAPHGTGLLYVRRDKIAGLWPLMAAGEDLTEDIRKFEQIGTHPAAATLAIAQALSFHQGIGARRKEARLTELRDYWAKRLSANDRVHLNTSLKPGLACGIANMRVEGVDTLELNGHLWREHRILATAIKHEDCAGLRVSPSVYTRFEELDRFCEVVEHVIENGLPA